MNLSRTSQVTFVLHDAGETKAMQPVMRELDRLRVPYGIIAQGTARKLLGNDPHVVPSPTEIRQGARINPAWGHYAQNLLNHALASGTVVTGVVSDFQKQWADYFLRLGRQVVGYYDGFSFPKGSSVVDAFSRSLSMLVTAGGDAARHFQQRYPGLSVTALGQPTLEAFSRPVSTAARAQLQRVLRVNPHQPTLLFVGGYGEGYEASFRLFVQAAQQSAKDGSNILVSLHPKADGQLEQRILQQLDGTGRIRIIPKAIPTDQALIASDVVLTHQSTMATQALFQRKPVFLVGKAADDSSRHNPLLETGLVRRFTKLDELQGRIKQHRHAWKSGQNPSGNPWLSPQALYARLNIPPDATHNITRLILSLLQRIPPQQLGYFSA